MVGAEITDVAIAPDLVESVIGDIIGALHAHSVIFLRDQKIDSGPLLALSRRLGPAMTFSQASLNLPDWPEITRLSNILVDGKPIGLLESGQYWHTDRSFHAVPQGYAMLYAIEIPRDGRGLPLGDTIFVSTAHAYDTLPTDVKARIGGLRAIHSYQNPRKKQLSPGRDALIRLDDHHKPPVSHPVVRSHPVTGRKCLYVNQQYCMGIEGMNEDEGRELIDYLCRHITREEAQYRHRWAEGDLLIWDDCAIQHCAVGDYNLPQRRLIHRIGIQGTAPS